MSTVYNQFSHKRLLKDLASYIKNEDAYPYIKVRPLDDNIYEWHGNITPIDTHFDGFIIHFIMIFPINYPISPPKISLCSGIPHSNIIPDFCGEKYFLCLDLINNFFWLTDNRDTDRPFSGWSASYTVEHIVGQLYTFLFDETVENYDGRIKKTIYQLPPELGGGERDYNKMPALIEKYENEAKEFTCSLCGHTHNKPYPHVKQTDPSRRRTDLRADVIKFHNTEDKTMKYTNEVLSSIIKLGSEDIDIRRFYNILHDYYKKNTTFDKLIYTLESKKFNWNKELPYYFDKSIINNNQHCQKINPSFFTYINTKINNNLDKSHYYKFIKKCVGEYITYGLILPLFDNKEEGDRFIIDNELLFMDVVNIFTDGIINFNIIEDTEYTAFDTWNKLLNKVDKSLVLDYYSNSFKYWILNRSVHGSAYVTGCECEYCVNVRNGQHDKSNITNIIIQRVLDIYFYYCWISPQYNYYIISNNPHFTKNIDLASMKMNDKDFINHIAIGIFNRDETFGAEDIDIYEYLDKYIEENNSNKPVNIVKHKNIYIKQSYFDLLPEELIINILDRLSSIDRQKVHVLPGNIKQIISSPYYRERLWLECFHSKMNYTESKLGYPLIVKFEYSGLMMKQCKTTFDILSYECYNELEIQHTVWNQQFTFWLPLYINYRHWNKSFKVLVKQVNNYMKYNTRQQYDRSDRKKQAIALDEMVGREDKYNTYKLRFGKEYHPNNDIYETGNICTNTSLDINPYYIVDIYTTFMTNIIVDIMKGEIHLSLKVLEGFCQIYRTFYQLSLDIPKIKTIIDEKLKNFIRKPQHRHKTYTPNLGNMLMMLTISDTYSWKDIRKHYLEESGDRNIMWILKEYPFMAKVEKPEKLLEESYIIDDTTKTVEDAKKTILQKIFDITIVGKKLLLFNLYFVNEVIGDDKKKFINMLDRNYGFPTDKIKEKFQQDIAVINNLKSYDEFYKSLAIYKPNDTVLSQKIISSRIRSTKKGYNKSVLEDKKEEEELKWERTA